MSSTIEAILARAALKLALTLVPELLVAVGMFLVALPRRRHFAVRIAVSSAAMLAVSYLLYRWLLFGSVLASRSVSLALEGVNFLVLLAMLVVIIKFSSVSSIWTALFCATAAYTIQNLASCLTYFAFLLIEGGGTNMSSPLFLPLNVLGVAVVYPICYHFFIRPIRTGGLTEIEDHNMIFMFALVALIAIVFDMENKELLTRGIPLGYVMVLRVVHDILCVITLGMQFEMLYSRSLEANMVTMERIGADQERHFHLMRESIDAVNERMDALRRHVRELADTGGAGAEKLSQIANETQLPGVRVSTGNEALDALLLVKGLVCEREGVTLSSIADGGALSFMEPTDVYALIGNAIDNSLEAVASLPDPEKRAIGLVAKRAGGMVTINVINYFSGKVTLVDGLPQTTAKNPVGHGLGTRSMRSIAEKYGGTVTFSTDGDVFHVNALIPIPEDAA